MTVVPSRPVRVGDGAPPLRYGLVGHGWRADFYLRLARQVPALFDCVGVVVRRPEVASALETAWGVPTFAQVDDLVTAAAPELLVTSVPRAATPAVIAAGLTCGVAVLAETPPAATVDDLRRLWADVGGTGLVEVAEQYPSLPYFQAVRALLDLDVLGDVGVAQVSWTHDYHAVALLRVLLGVGGEPVRVRAVRTTRPVLEGPGRGGWPQPPGMRATDHTLALLEFDGRTGVYDFTDGQWFNPLRPRHLLVRAGRGEISDLDVVWADHDGRPCRTPITRRQTGLDGNLEGADLDVLTWHGTTLYRNPFPGARLSDEEIAIATVLQRTGLWRRGGGPEPYPLADACQDHLVALAIHAAAATGTSVHTGREAWAAHLSGPATPSAVPGRPASPVRQQ